MHSNTHYTEKDTHNNNTVVCVYVCTTMQQQQYVVVEQMYYVCMVAGSQFRLTNRTDVRVVPYIPMNKLLLKNKQNINVKEQMYYFPKGNCEQLLINRLQKKLDFPGYLWYTIIRKRGKHND